MEFFSPPPVKCRHLHMAECEQERCENFPQVAQSEVRNSGMKTVPLVVFIMGKGPPGGGEGVCLGTL